MGIFGVDETALAENLISQLSPVIDQKIQAATALTEHGPSEPEYSGRRIAESLNRPANYVPITQNAQAVITLNWHRMATIMQKLIMQTGITKRLHSAIRNYIIGDGLEYMAKSKASLTEPYLKSVNEVLEKFVTDPRNNLKQAVHDMVFEHSAFGETALPVTVDPVNGTVVLGTLPALWIEEVKLNPLNSKDVLSIRTRQGQWLKSRGKEGGKMNFTGTPHDLPVIRYQAERYCLDPKTNLPLKVTDEATKLETYAVNADYGTLSGKCFYFRSNTLNGSARGWGDSFQVMDLCQALDQFLFDSMNRLDMQASVVWDLEVDGGDNDVKKWQNQPLPTGGQMFAHNKKLKLTPLAPAIKVEEFVNFIKLLRQLIAGSVGIPEYAMGYGGDTNVATAKEQAPVMNSEFNNRRTWWENTLRFIFRFVLEQANKAGMLYHETDKTSKVLTTEELDDIELAINFKPFNRDDVAAMSEAMSSLANALMIMEQNEYISHDVAAQVCRQALAGFGIEVSAQAEEQTIKQEIEEVEGESGKTLDFTASESAKRKVKKRK